MRRNFFEEGDSAGVAVVLTVLVILVITAVIVWLSPDESEREREEQTMKQMMNARRIKVLILDPLEVGRFFTNTTTFKLESKLPLDAKCVSVDKDVRNNRLLFWYESKEFDLVKEGDVAQELPWDTFMIYDEGN